MRRVRLKNAAAATSTCLFFTDQLFMHKTRGNQRQPPSILDKLWTVEMEGGKENFYFIVFYRKCAIAVFDTVLKASAYLIIKESVKMDNTDNRLLI